MSGYITVADDQELRVASTLAHDKARALANEGRPHAAEVMREFAAELEAELEAQLDANWAAEMSA